ncbi:MAG: DUF1501 domain-containing protein [Alphaproteobacteria bacterium]|nr:DUF1501 domain-containing protein [Alphaproteobacteria bacterium]
MFRMNRRQFGLLSAAGLLCPRPARAAVSAAERRFLFIFCSGGWDTTFVFTPLGDSPDVDTEPRATTATGGGIPFVDAASRPSVRRFFETWGDRSCLINGIEVQSITHERCRELILTGRSNLGGDDWPSILGGRAPGAPNLPHLVLAGPAFTRDYTAQVVRIGDNGQLPALLTGDALRDANLPGAVPGPEVQALEEAFVRRQLLGQLDPAGGGQQQAFLRQYAQALGDVEVLAENASQLSLEPRFPDCERDIVADAATAMDCFQLGLSRCAMTRYNGWCDEGWDTHQGLELQDINFEDLFAYLGQIQEELARRTGLSGRPLSEEVVTVVFSEMGRAPRYNAWLGKDHWTFTSALLIGGGVAGGRVIGAVDDHALGQPVDLASGEVHTSGTRLLPEHLGATLLALGDVDPGDYTGGAEPIAAALS